MTNEQLYLLARQLDAAERHLVGAMNGQRVDPLAALLEVQQARITVGTVIYHGLYEVLGRDETG
jgi:hypothetical protein